MPAGSRSDMIERHPAELPLTIIRENAHEINPAAPNPVCAIPR